MQHLPGVHAHATLTCQQQRRRHCHVRHLVLAAWLLLNTQQMGAAVVGCHCCMLLTPLAWLRIASA
jgi:hypothetical protein